MPGKGGLLRLEEGVEGGAWRRLKVTGLRFGAWRLVVMARGLKSFGGIW